MTNELDLLKDFREKTLVTPMVSGELKGSQLPAKSKSSFFRIYVFSEDSSFSTLIPW